MNCFFFSLPLSLALLALRFKRVSVLAVVSRRQLERDALQIIPLATRPLGAPMLAPGRLDGETQLPF